MGFEHYAQDTIEKCGDMVAGLRVDTGFLSGLTYWTIGGQTEYFNVFGVIKVLNMYIEQIVIDGAPGATLLQWNMTSTTPVIAVQPLSGLTVTLATLVQGGRVIWLGGAVATLPILTFAGGITDFSCASPQILGTEGGVATIGVETTIAAASAGTHQVSIFYMPMSDGAYVTNVL